MMIPVALTSVTTSDGMVLDGVITEPRKKSGHALIWIHGLGANFSYDQQRTQDISRACLKNNIAHIKFDTRGHHLAHRNTPKKKGLQGSAFEDFRECVLDIRAMIRFARKLGYQKIILAGHSTGANKALYYLYKTRDPAVNGLLLLGPINDIAAGRKKFGAPGLARGITIAEKLFRKSPAALMPSEYGVFTAKRFLSMFRPGSAEDVFPYLDTHASWKELKSIHIPLGIVFGRRDEYLDRPAQKLIEIFRAHAPLAKSFSGVIIKNADHGFKGKEKELSKAVVGWIQRAVV